MFLYNLAIYIISPYLILRIMLEAIKRKSGLIFIKQRLGLSFNKKHQKVIWLHAASVGETKIALDLFQNLSKLLPEDKFIITTNTSPAANIISENKNLTHLYLPLDWFFATKRFINIVDPKICILIETEIWPNLIKTCKRNNIPIVVANARLSKKTTKNLDFIKEIYKEILLNINE